MPRVHQTNTPNDEIYTKTSGKEAQGSNMMGLPRWQSVCSLFDPRAMNYDPMIRRNGWPRFEAAKERLPQLNMEGKPDLDGLPRPH
ncbi:hypothetical protein Tco_0169806 [Tanacetum coccineum]